VKRFRKQSPLDLDARLRKYRPELRADLLQALVGRARQDERKRVGPGSLRVGLAAALTGLAVLGLALAGGLGQAATSAGDAVAAAKRLVAPSDGVNSSLVQNSASSQQYFGNRCGQNPPKKPPKEPRKCPVQAGNASVREGNSGTRSLVFPVSIGDGLVPADTVTATYATTPGTATPVVDYTPVTGTVTFAAGQTLKTVSVPVVGDTIPEPNETLFLVLSNPSANAFISVAQGTGTIINDD
jgi:Calx-beta domain